ncbi:cob(I)yrinic acid a,c-diamide adenosyltransferase [Portibacter marinus]|uniref:cob(I)yrinic acid a,c-diamide adenosyltransferase n=1 Tax=Portibacter marinus TaxID=2898660 RepID=UPI001F1C99EB|nr:cob(I)yrinic acid a,c-diamide adenosyltransferase [Portibacter marinus]
MKIYTKKGDGGQTSLFGGQKVSKDDLRIEAYGTTDELNAFIGQLISLIDIEVIITLLLRIQDNIFVMGSMLSSPKESKFKIPTIEEADIQLLENEIDNMEHRLEPLQNFILPSGSQAISLCHICRTIARRAERRVVSLEQSAEVNPLIKKYLNRLSDYFFVLARFVAAKTGVRETVWKPKR